MRIKPLSALILFLAGATPARAQPLPEPAPPVEVLVRPVESLWSVPGSDPEPGPEKIWLSLDYLLWWVRSGPLNAPLVTTGSPLDAIPGALGQPHTRVLFGNQPLNFGALSGLRLGGGCDLGSWWALEGNYFALERAATGFRLSSNANGNPVIARPVFDNQAGMPSAYADALPGVFTGGIDVSARSHLLGFELNLATKVYRGPSVSFDFLAGFRTLELNEDVTIQDSVAAINPGVLTFTGMPADPPDSLTILDRFHVYNRFYGGQVGGRLEWHGDRLTLGVVGKLALGASQQLALVDGATNLISAGNPSTPNVGGILAQPTNIRRFYQTNTGVVPEFGVNAGYWLTPNVRLGCGYEFLYWNRVSRPGEMIDTTVNPGLVPRDPNFGNGLGAPRPAFQLRPSDFWAQGFHVGVMFQY
jgi:hypothetical protein